MLSTKATVLPMTRTYEQRARARAAEQTRRRILDAVYKRLAAAPAERLNIDDVAHHAGVVRSTVYAVFGSKAGLFDAFGADVLRRGGFDELLAAAEHPDPREAVVGTIRGAVRIYESHRDVLRAVYSMARLDPDALGGAVERLETGRARGMLELATRLADRDALKGGVSIEDATDVLALATAFSSFDQLDVRGRSGPDIVNLLVAIAERTLYR
jgi:AcrR family transcriptional regulator